ncbi:MAG: hypothetical protein GX601_19620 [Anaerolineales bacterium]|nr:hypothetical protein [Anaerolineales bacterium]
MAVQGWRQWLQVLAAVAIGVGIVAVGGYLLLSRSASPAPGGSQATPTQSTVELWDAYEQARAAAQGRLADATLVSASTQWQQPDEHALLAGARDWSFVFYSAEQKSVLDVAVSTGEAQVVKQTRVWVAPGILAEGKWRAGPRDALLAFLACEGEAFLADHPETVVDLNLAQGEDGDPVWTVVALDVSDRSALAVSIDGETGSVVAYTS